MTVIKRSIYKWIYFSFLKSKTLKFSELFNTYCVKESNCLLFGGQ
jgi:hypothetical protein